MNMTIDEVRDIRFPIARSRGEGYRALEVDEFVDEVLARMEAGQDIESWARDVVFPVSTRPGEGYTSQEVDEFIDRLCAHTAPTNVVNLFGARQPSWPRVRMAR